MRKRNRLIEAALAMLLAVLLCFALAGCDTAQFAELLGDLDLPDSIDGEQQPVDYVSDSDVYSLPMFDDLPETQSDIDPLFWVAEGSDGGRVYLLGSIHVARRDTYRLPDLLMNAYFESDSIAVEFDTIAYLEDTTAQYQDAMKFIYSDGSKLSDHLDPELCEGLAKFFDENKDDYITGLGYTTEILASCKPAMWQSILDQIVLGKTSLSADYGIDTHFLNLAKGQNKEIIELESYTLQSDMLAGFSNELWEMLLSQYIEYPMDEMTSSFEELYETWSIGDAQGILGEEPTDEDFEGYTQDEIDEYFELMDEYNTAMLTDRNLGMTDKAEQMLKNGDNVFYIVGAGHMVGDDGIVALLRERGYTVTQLGGIGADGSYVRPTTTSTSTTTAYGAVPTTEFDYDLYVEMYEYFGGTTAATTRGTTTRTTRSTTTTTDSGGDDGYDGSGVFG